MRNTESLATFKWYEDKLYVWSGNQIRWISVVNGQVVGPNHRRVFEGPTAFAIAGRFDLGKRKLLWEGFVLALPAKELLLGLV